MSRLIDDIGAFLEAGGFEYSFQTRYDFDVICVKTLDESNNRIILPLEISARTVGNAMEDSQKAAEAIRMIRPLEGYPIIVPEDRWHRQKEMMQARIMAHLELFSQAYARNCEVRRIDKETARRFLTDNHSYGYAACKYRYGLFLKKHTGHIAREIQVENFPDRSRNENNGLHSDTIGRLIAVATFSNARKWIKDGKEIRSYEWTRYASLPDLRVSGGMGKLLKAFIKEVQPDDIMSYADLEWSEGGVYKMLGFKEELSKEAVGFEIDPETWERRAVKGLVATAQMQEKSADKLYYINFGSRKLRLKLTEYR